jgi:hypothetical protein
MCKIMDECSIRDHETVACKGGVVFMGWPMSEMGPNSEVGGRNSEVRFTPESRLNSDIAACSFRAHEQTSPAIRSIRRRGPSRPNNTSLVRRERL